MKKTYYFHLLVDGNIIENHPELIIAKTKDLGLGFDEKLLEYSQTSLLSVWPDNISVFITGTEPMDLVLCTPWMEMVSERAKNIMERYPLDQVEFLPITVYDEEGKEFSKMKYWVLHVYKIIADALDWETTKWLDPSPPSKDDPWARGKIIIPSFFIEKVRNEDLFRCEVAGKVNSSLYISAGLKRALTKEGSTIGMDFSPARTT